MQCHKVSGYVKTTQQASNINVAVMQKKNYFFRKHAGAWKAVALASAVSSFKEISIHAINLKTRVARNYQFGTDNFNINIH